MNLRLRELLRCPRCRGELDLEVYERGETEPEVNTGLLTCRECANAYAVWRGIPRMLLEEELRLPESFVDASVTRLPESLQIPTRPRRPHANRHDLGWSFGDEAEFSWGQLSGSRWLDNVCRHVDFELGELRDRLFLDAGCGNGLLGAIVSSAGAEVIAFDFSDVVERAEMQRKERAGHAKVHYLQADVVHPPFAPGSCDVVYSDGVIHFTSDPRRAFKELAALVAGDGRMFVAVSRRDVSRGLRLRRLLINFAQRLVRPLPMKLARSAYLAGAFLLSMYIRSQHLIGRKKDRPLMPLRHEAIYLANIVTYTEHRYYTTAELKSWFQAEDFESTAETMALDFRDTCCGVLGVKKAVSSAGDS